MCGTEVSAADQPEAATLASRRWGGGCWPPRGRHIRCTSPRWRPLTTQRPPHWRRVAEVAATGQPEAAILAARRWGGGRWPTKGRHMAAQRWGGGRWPTRGRHIGSAVLSWRPPPKKRLSHWLHGADVTAVDQCQAVTSTAQRSALVVAATQ